MKLIKCYVSSFGKLKDFSYDFSSGLNTFKEDNGWGKSTLATFIKAMFYGISSGKRSVAENERIKFKPWNSTERFGGSVDFVWGDKQYRIERFFGNKESEDSVRLFDAVTGKEFQNTENLGKRIFEIDEEGFLSTTFFSQKDFQVKSNSSLTAKFNSVCEIQDTEAFDKALIKLEEKAKQYKYRGDKGLISDTKREINILDEQIERAESSVVAVNVIKNDVKLLEEKVEQLKNKANELTEKVTLAGKAEANAVKKQRHDELIEEKNSLIKECERIDKVLNGHLPNDGELSMFSDCYNDLVSVSALKRATDEQLIALQNDKPNQKQNAKGKALPFAVLSCLFLVIGLATVWFSLIVGIISVVLFAISLIGVIYVGVVKKPQIDNGYESAVQTQLTKQAEYAELQSEYIIKLNEYLSKYNLPDGCDFKQALEIIKSCAIEKKNVLKVLEKTENSLKVFDGEKQQFISVVPTMNVAKLRQELSSVQEEYAREANALAIKRASIKTHEDVVNSIPDLESKKSELIVRLEQYNEDYKILTLTSEYLQKADENLKVKYRQPLQDSLNKYLSLITGKNNNANIDVDLNLTVMESGGNKVPDYYSKGYQNLFEICKRFALIDVLFTGEKPFVILDDPFYNLDDVKLDGALELVKKLSDEYQILYFVCHESRRA